MTARHRCGLRDVSFENQQLDWGLGLALDSRIHHGGGRTSTAMVRMRARGRSATRGFAPHSPSATRRPALVVTCSWNVGRGRPHPLGAAERALRGDLRRPWVGQAGAGLAGAPVARQAEAIQEEVGRTEKQTIPMIPTAMPAVRGARPITGWLFAWKPQIAARASRPAPRAPRISTANTPVQPGRLEGDLQEGDGRRSRRASRMAVGSCGSALPKRLARAVRWPARPAASRRAPAPRSARAGPGPDAPRLGQDASTRPPDHTLRRSGRVS